MSKIKDLSQLVKNKIAEWEKTPDEDIFCSTDPFEPSDRFEYLEIVMAELIGCWYVDTKEIIKGKGGHTLGVQKESIKDSVHLMAIKLRQKNNEDSEFARGHVIYCAAKIYEYAKCVYRRKDDK